MSGRKLNYLGVLVFSLCVSLGGCPADQAPPAAVDAAAPAQVEPQPGPAVAPADKAPSSPAKVVQEVEPNEQTKQAMELAEPCTVEATLEAAKDPKSAAVDWYRIALGARQVVAIEVSGVPEQNLKLSLLDRDLNAMFEVDDRGPGEGERFPNLGVEQAVFLKVSGDKGGAGGAYRLTVAARELGADEELEHNGRYSAATPLKLGQAMQGYLGYTGDEDWYLLDLQELAVGSVLRIELTGVEGVRPQLLVADKEERRPLLEVKAPQAGEGITVRNMGLPPNPGSVYLQLKSAWVPGPQPKKFIRTANPSVAYKLSVSSEAGGDDLEKEPDDSAAQAMPILDGQKMRGYLSAPDDIDYYRLEVERPSLLSAELTPPPRVDLRLSVVDPAKKDQEKDFHLLRADEGKVAEPEVIVNCALQPGTHWLRVEGSWKKVDGKWVRDFFNLDETYSLAVNLRADEGREEREPNDAARATPIKVGDSLRGNLHPRGDTDAFLLDLSGQDGPRNTRVECTGIPKLDIALKLLGPEKDEKGNPRVVASSARGKGEEKEELSKELMPGEYLIVVSGSPSSESNAADQYVLTVTQP